MKIQVKVKEVAQGEKGSAYFGNYGHAGIPGSVGGSAPSSGTVETYDRQKFIKSLGGKSRVQIGNQLATIDTVSGTRAVVIMDGSRYREVVDLNDVRPVGTSNTSPIIAETLVDNKPMLVYHATTTEAVNSILRTGLRETTENKQKGIQRGVYFTTDLAEAAGYGDMALDAADRYAVIKFSIPAEYHDLVKSDSHDRELYETTTASYIPMAVPPEWITEVTTYMSGGYKPKVMYRKSKSLQYYSTVLIM